MAIVQTFVAYGGNKTSGTSSPSTTVTADAAIGDLILVAISADNAGTNGVSSITAPTDTKSNTYTLVKEQNITAAGVANDVCTVAIYQSILTAALVSGTDRITAYFSPATTAEAFGVYLITGAVTTNYSTDSVSGSGTTYTLPTSASFTTGDLYFAAVANESNTPAAFDTDDITYGVWHGIQVASAADANFTLTRKETA